MINPFDDDRKELVLIDENLFIKMVNNPPLDREYASEGPYKTNVLKFIDHHGKVLFLRVRCKVNRRGQPVDGFNVEKGIFEDNKKRGVV
jgi:hypothetical protein